MSGTPLPSRLRKLHSINGLDQASGAHAQPQAGIHVIVEGIDEAGHLVALEARARKQDRKAASGYVTRGLEGRSTEDRRADTGDIGTCEFTTVGLSKF